jgi:hypothetical protein
MEDHGLPAPLVWLGLAALAVGLYFLTRWFDRKRTQAWAQLAASIGCQLAAADPFGILATCEQPIFRVGESRRVSNVLSGLYRAHEVRCFDYRYTEGSGRDSTTYELTVVMITAPVPFATMVVRPESFGDKLAAAIGLEDINFESDEFSRSFYVRSSDRRFAYDVLHPRAMEFLLRDRRLTIQTSPTSLVFFRGTGPRLGLPDEVRALMDEGCDFVELLPERLLQDRPPQ